MNHAQNKMLHGLLNKTGLMADKASIVSGITKGRSESSKELSFDEARLMITWLKQQPIPLRQAQGGILRQAQYDSANLMRRKIISMAHEIGWHNLVNGKWQIDMRSLNNWCLQHSYLKKELNKYTTDELPKLVSQFERVYKSFLKKF